MKFATREAFEGVAGYRLLPMRFRRLPWDIDRVLVSSMSGDWITLQHDHLRALVERSLKLPDEILADLEARHLVVRDVTKATLAPLLSQYRSRKAAVVGGPALHIVVVSLRCHHSCSYCQVSRQPTSASLFDMDWENGTHVVNRLFEWPSPSLTIEFQGGEPLLHFDRVRQVVEQVSQRNVTEQRRLRFVVASTLHDLTDDQLAFMADHNVHLSTSLDGPEWLHNANRPRPERDSYRRTVEGIERVRRVLGNDRVSALTTLTKSSLDHPHAIIDEYRKLGLASISLRPLSPYGFARKAAERHRYTTHEFLSFYRIALPHILEVNRAGFAMEESYAGILLSQLLTPFSHGYVDLRSPTGAGFGAVVYDYNGQVYPSDEARMLAAMGDASFAMGRVEGSVPDWLKSDAMAKIMEAGVAESIPQCSDCVYVPLCGADPIDHHARQGDTVGHRPTSDFCKRQMGMFDLLLETWEKSSARDRLTLEGWGVRSREEGENQERERDVAA